MDALHAVVVPVMYTFGVRIMAMMIMMKHVIMHLLRSNLQGLCQPEVRQY
jgi:hypothetical protein